MAQNIENAQNLSLQRCPHCRTLYPNLEGVWAYTTKNHEGEQQRYWRAYVCRNCGGMVLAWSWMVNKELVGVYPERRLVDDAVPVRPREYLSQAMDSPPAPAVMAAASAVDAMLKEKGLTEGSLYSRIDAAAEAHLITNEMKAWAHEVRLDANDQRHADLQAPLPDADDARRVIDFADALAMFLFVLPNRVNRGRGNEADP